MSCEILYGFTKDNVRLQGIHYVSDDKDICLLCIHGMGGSFIENKFYSILGSYLKNKNISMFFGHNRGHNHINDLIIQKEDGSLDSKRFGTTYEIFEDCIFDIDMWVNKVKELGYKKIIILGHSLGCNKSIYYLSQNTDSRIKGLILASPTDMICLGNDSTHQPNYNSLHKESKQLLSEGKGKTILSKSIWNYYNLSAKTFNNFFTEGNTIDNLPLSRNPERFEQLEKITIPIFTLRGELDDVIINSNDKDLQLIKKKAINCPNFKTAILPKADHCYNDKEFDLAKEVYKWINEVIKHGS